MRVGAVVSDLMFYSRIESVATAAGVTLVRVNAPEDLSNEAALDLVLVDWSARQPGWSGMLSKIPGRIILFGPHTDLEAHLAAKTAGLGPMWARSKLVAVLPAIFAP